MEYTTINGTGETAIVQRTYEKTEMMNIKELIAKIADMEAAARGKLASRDHFIDTLQALVDDTGLKITVPAKLKLS